MEELYPIAVEVIDSNGQGLQSQVKVYLFAVLGVRLKHKFFDQFFDDFCLGFWNLIFILLHHLIWIQIRLHFDLAVELFMFLPIEHLEF